MKPYSFSLAVALCLLLTSCETLSVNPLSSPATSHADPQLVGLWRTKSHDDKETFRFSITKDPWMHIVVIPDPDDKSKVGEQPESYDVFPTVIGKDTFLNVVMINKDKEGHPTKSYLFLRYTISSNHTLHMWMISDDAAAAAVRSGKLKGIVTENKSMTIGKQPHPDIDVMLQDSGATLEKFIRDESADTLFQDKTNVLYRVASDER